MGSKATLTNCTFHNNYALRGGGIYVSSGQNAAAGDLVTGVTLSHCMFTSNLAHFSASDPGAPANGGGMYLNSFVPTLNNCTFTGNSTVVDAHAAAGSAIYSVLLGPHLTDCTITGNNCVGVAGAAIWSESCGVPACDLILTRTKVCSNTASVDGSPVTNPQQVYAETYTHSASCVMVDCSSCPPPSGGGDLDGDGDVDADDLGLLHAQVGICESDTDHDGSTNVIDLLLVISEWGNTCP